MLNEMVLRASDEELAASDSWRNVLRRQICFFGEEDGLKGLLQWIGEKNPFFERLIALAGTFNSANLRKPVRVWFYVDEFGSGREDHSARGTGASVVCAERLRRLVMQHLVQRKK
jgi:hypothetical protein